MKLSQLVLISSFIFFFSCCEPPVFQVGDKVIILEDLDETIPRKFGECKPISVIRGIRPNYCNEYKVEVDCELATILLYIPERYLMFANKEQ
jgi:hypothetical protein